MSAYLEPDGHVQRVFVGHATAAGEEFVSPGVGERMIAYLKRTYGGQASHSSLARDGAWNGNALIAPVGPAPRRTLFTCSVCGVLFEPMCSTQKHCRACSDLRHAAPKAQARSVVGSGRIVTAICGNCGQEFTYEASLHNAKRLYCSQRCKVQASNAHSLERYYAQLAAGIKRSWVERGPITHSLVCAGCGKPFDHRVVGAGGMNRRYCSDGCRREAENKRRRHD